MADSVLSVRNPQASTLITLRSKWQEAIAFWYLELPSCDWGRLGRLIFSTFDFQPIKPAIITAIGALNNSGDLCAKSGTLVHIYNPNSLLLTDAEMHLRCLASSVWSLRRWSVNLPQDGIKLHRGNFTAVGQQIQTLSGRRQMLSHGA